MKNNMVIGIIGTGKIVDEMLPVVTALSGIKVGAICSRSSSSLPKAKKLAATFGIDNVYTDYNLMLQQADIDFVYVALTNNAHAEYAESALSANKNVIVEKPICTSAAELTQLAHIALTRHLYLFEAVTLLHMPHYRRLKDELLQTIGAVKLIECNYSQRSSRYDLYQSGRLTPAFDPACFGGALMDINIYNINFVVSLFGEPRYAEYRKNTGFNGIDTSGVAILQYPDFVATCIGAKDCDGRSFGSIQGDSGRIETDGPVSVLSALKVYADGRETTIDAQAKKHRLFFEFEHFRDIFTTNNYDTMKYYLEISMQVMRVVDRLRNNTIM